MREYGDIVFHPPPFIKWKTENFETKFSQKT